MAGAAVVSMGSIEREGNEILDNYCNKYPDNSSSHILPPYFLSNHPEARCASSGKILPNHRHLTLKEKRQLIGIETRQWGEIGEHMVFQAFHELSCKTQIYSFLSILNFSLDNDNPRQLKEMELRNELPAFPTNTKMDIELDMAVFLKDLGVVGIEVKSSAIGKALSKAEEQLTNGGAFFSSLMATITGSSASILPYVRVICVPHDSSPSPSGKTADNSHLLNKDLVTNIGAKWNDIVSELVTQRASSTFTSSDYKKFTNICVGLWSSIPTPSGLVFDRYKGSTVEGVKEADCRVNTSLIASDSKPLTKPLTKVKYNQPCEAPRQCKELELVYLTMEQKVLYDTCRQVIVRGVAGSGKSLLILIKIIHLVRSGDKNNILLLGSYPFILKCDQILQENGLTTSTLKTFPGKSSPVSAHPTANVVIMNITDFLRVSKQVLDDYDLSGYHLFFDDTQIYYIDSFTTNARYTDIATFLDATYHKAHHNNLYLWVCMDFMQSMECNFDDCDITSLLYVNKTTSRALKIPVYELNKVLRNTKEIIQLVKYTREERIKSNSLSACTSDIVDGHNITCTPIIYHKLKQGTHRDFKDPFYLKMLEGELSEFLCMTPALLPSQFAILTEGGTKTWDINALVTKTAGCSIQSVEDWIKNSNTSDIVCDNMGSTSSFEFPCVVYIRTVSPGTVSQLYNLFTRARSKLVVIDCNIYYPPMTTPNVHLVTWDVDPNGEFVQL